MRKKPSQAEQVSRRLSRVPERGLRTRIPDYSTPQGTTKPYIKYIQTCSDQPPERRSNSVVRAPELKPILNHNDFFSRGKSPVNSNTRKSTFFNCDEIPRLNSSRNTITLGISKDFRDMDRAIPSRSHSIVPKPLGIQNDPLRIHNRSDRDILTPKCKFSPSIDEKVSILLRDRYSVIKTLGQGAYSTIFLGQSLELPGHFVAIKIIRNSKKSAGKEFEILRSLDHENIIRAEELIIDQQTSQAILILELAGERTLGDIQNYIEGHVFPEAKAVLFFTQIAKALQHMHNQNIVHSDLKTDNVSLVDDNSIKLIDFGFSRKVEEPSNVICGTLGYMSPQQLRKVSFCPFKADVWSLGVLLFKLLFNLYPIKAKTMEEAAMKVKGFKLVLPTSRKLCIATKQLLLTLLTVDEARRPTIDEIIQEFSFLFLR